MLAMMWTVQNNFTLTPKERSEMLILPRDFEEIRHP